MADYRKVIPWVLWFMLVGMVSCFSDRKKVTVKNDSTLFTLLPPEETRVTFRNDVLEDSTLNIIRYNYGYNGGGVAVGDLNNDGLPDLVFTSNQHGAKVYLNKGGLKFEDITSKCGVDDTTGWTTGVTLADVNGDGWLDIYVCKSGGTGGRIRENRLYINNKNLTFTERGREFGLNDGEPSTNAVFFDYDNDGDLDCFIINHPENFDPVLRPLAFTGTSTLPTGRDRMLENVNGHFVDVTEKAGLGHSYGYGLSVSVSDINGDGYDDLFIANDYLSDDQLYINNGNKTFSNKTSKYLAHTSLFSMGSDFGDINNDGKQDLMVVDMKPDNHFRIKNNLFFFPMEFYYSEVNVLSPHQFIQNSLQLATDTGAYSEISQLSGVDKTDWSWNVLIQDFDNDGWNDIHITNGTKRDENELDFVMLIDDAETHRTFWQDEKKIYEGLPITPLKHFAYRNKHNLQFEDVSKKWGLDAPSKANGAAYADLDGDGDLDLIVNNTDSTAFIFRNNADKMLNNHYLRIRLIGKGQNTFGLGAMAKVHAGDLHQTKELENGRGFQSCSEPVLHFGLGDKKKVDSLEIFWKDGRYSILRNIKVDRLLIISEDSSVMGRMKKFSSPSGPQLLREKPKTILNFVHRESKFNDFKRDRMLPYQLSKEGPGMAVADVNGDGLDDIFITNGAGSSGKLFLQSKDGRFSQSNGQPWSNDSSYEGLGAVFFDANGDGNPDLYIATGSNEFKEGDKQLKDKLYINDGKGHFKDASDWLPSDFASNSCVVAFDFNGDGREDLFVGGRLVPGKFPLAGDCSLLRNDGNKFTDVTEELAPGLKNIGMVNSALFTDFDNDGKIDLIVCGEWMPISFFKNTGGRFENITASTGIGNQKGLWKSIVAGDFDNDGDMDYIVGNLGWNSFLKADTAQPVEVLLNDFDDNGTLEPLVFHYLQGQRAPLADRNTFCEQMPKYRKIFKTFRSYASANWNNVITPEQWKQSKKYSVTQLSSCLLENLGNGKFRLKPLPVEAQVSPLFGSCVFDFNNDGNADVLVQGNWASNLFSLSPYDAGRGLLLLGDGKGGFSANSYGKSGFYVPGDAKSLTVLATPLLQPLFISASNSDTVKSFGLSSSPHYHVVNTKLGELSALLTFKDGHRQKIEFKNITGYLSQSSATQFIPIDVKSMKIFGPYYGSREITF